MFRIYDWAGNLLFDGKEFLSFDDGWSFIWESFPEEECFDDYYVFKEL